MHGRLMEGAWKAPLAPPSKPSCSAASRPPECAKPPVGSVASHRWMSRIACAAEIAISDEAPDELAISDGAPDEIAISDGSTTGARRHLSVRVHGRFMFMFMFM